MLLASCGFIPTAQAQPDTAEDLVASVTRMAKIGSCSSPSFSPDGRTLAFISNMSGLPQIWTVPTQGGWPTLITALDDAIGGVLWSPRGDWLAFSMAPGGGMNQQIHVCRPDGSEMKRLTDGGSDNNWLGDWTRDGKSLMFASSRRDPAAMDAWLVDVESGEMTLGAQNTGIGYFSSISKDNSRAILYRLASRGNNNLHLADLATGETALLTPHDGPGSFSGVISPDGNTVYLSTNKDRDMIAFGRIKLGSNGRPGEIEILAARDDAELGGFKLNKDATLAALVWNVAGRSELEFLDLATNSHVPAVKLPSEILSGVTFSPDGSMIAMSLSGSTAPSDLWTLDLATQRLAKITDSPHAGIDLENLVKPELIKVKAADGLDLYGWLYLPRDFDKSSPPGPLVMSFHGGPEGQERPRFRSDYQALLSRGIAVFAPNVRGSSGFGKRFVNLDNGILRVHGVRDIKALRFAMIKRGYAHHQRIGIMGGSYGGYMVMAALTEFPNDFAAGANLFGVVNFETFFKHTEPWMAAISKVEYGDPDTEAEMLRMLSPIHKVDRVIAPTIVLHGANDTNVPVIEAEQVVDSLKARNVPVKYVLFPDEGHGWRKTKNRITSTVAIVEWFEKYLKE